MHRLRFLSYSLLLTGGALLMVAALLLFVAPQVANAQCGGETSSCLSCHVMNTATEFNGDSAWHTDHVTGGFCTNCHAGDKAAQSPNEAHTGLIEQPQTVPETSCASCHAANYETLNAAYLELAPVTAPANESAAPVGSVDPLDAPAVVDPLDAPAVVDPLDAPAVVDPLDAPAVVDPLDAPAVVDPLDAPAVVETAPETVAQAAPVTESAPDETGNRILLVMAEGLFVFGLGIFWVLERRA